LHDAVDCNPNGDPTDPENKPRIDEETGQGVITDVRLKRYIREQLIEDGYGVLVKKVTNDEDNLVRRGYLVKDVLEEDVKENLRNYEEELDVDVLEEFLNSAADVRFYGALLSIEEEVGEEDEVVGELKSRLPGKFEGPVQYPPARTMNAPVKRNEESNTLTSVVASSEDSSVGGFGLDDHRIKFGIYKFHGMVNENAARSTLLSEDDVRMLDSLHWRALKNQTHTRSKIGQEPRLYVRVEYSEDSYQYGDLHHLFELSDESAEASDMRNITDVVLDVSPFLNVVEKLSDRIETIHVKHDSLLEINHDKDNLADALEGKGVDVRRIKPYEEGKEYKNE
jgi:CRISPR-associated protein Csh2